MLLRALLTFTVTMGVALASGHTNPCDQGSGYWCRSYESAVQCGMVAWCKLNKLEHEAHQETANVDNKDEEVQLDAAPVEVTLYFESYCPGCKSWLQNTAYPAYQRMASSGILKLNLVPYGNAQERPYGSSYTFYCQHGAAECYGNKIESCAIHYMGDQSAWFPFIHCLEYYGPTDTNAQYCASLQKFDYTPIRTCANGEEGTQLEHQMALKTNALNPRHAYVPWLTMNGYHTDAIQNGLQSNMIAYVCATYTGTKPAVCNQVEAEIRAKAEPTTPCCHTCTEPKKKYYSIDKAHGMCGECCMDPKYFWIYKVFEPSLAKDNSTNTPCADRKYTVYTSTPTHGFGPVKMTLDLYDPTPKK